MFSNKFDYKINETISDSSGNFLIVQLVTENKNTTLCNLNGPNRDDPDFYQNIFEKIDSISPEYLTICGDYNIAQNSAIDYCNYLHVNNPTARELLLNKIEEFSLIDPFRELYPLRNVLPGERTIL